MNKDVCVIIPCAGKGSRLALPFPKELFPVGRNEVIIDSCLTLLKASAQRIRVVIVIDQHKLETVRYLKKYNSLFEMVFIYQKEDQEEFIGAVRSAENLFLKNNLVLLPDTLVEYGQQKGDIISLTVSLLQKHSIVFWAKKEKNIDVFKRDGALKLKKLHNLSIVEDYVDKPKQNFDRFNAIWASFAFKHEVHKTCLEEMHNRILGKDCDIENSILYGSPAIEVDQSLDLGTWDAVKSYLANKEYYL